MTLQRRTFVKAGLGTLATASLGCSPDESGSTAPQERWLSAQGDSAETYGLVVAEPGGISMTVTSGFRGHGLTQHPNDPGLVVMFARRPGRLGVIVDIEQGTIVQTFECAPHRQLAGHGCFTPDGAELLTVEIDEETAEGKIVVRDANTLDVIREFETYGIGPHELVWMPDEQTLAIANGGLITRPETGSAPINLATMRSSLTYVDVASGRLVAEERVAEDKASIRHLDVSSDGTVVVVMQVQREALNDTDPRPIVAVHPPGGHLESLTAGLEFAAAMRDYAGSVAIDEDSRLAAVTSPRGNLVGFWNIDTGAFAGHHEFSDVCGVAASHESPHFVLSGTGGQVRVIDAFTLEDDRDARERFDDIRWDNHMLTIRT